jgi:hypothetical protein
MGIDHVTYLNRHRLLLLRVSGNLRLSIECHDSSCNEGDNTEYEEEEEDVEKQYIVQIPERGNCS